MTKDVAVFLDLDNLVIGARQANLTFDVKLILDHIESLTNGRIVLQRAYGDWRLTKDTLKNLTTAGFVTQATVALNNFNKNLADIQIVVDAMETLADGLSYGIYVFITGDRDFTPLVQTLRKRGKQVIGVGVRHTTSSNLVSNCDKYIFYEDLVPNADLTETEVEHLLIQARDTLLKDVERERVSVLKQEMTNQSRGNFTNSSYSEGSFSKFLARYSHVITLIQEDTTVYFAYPEKPKEPVAQLHERYRSELKKRRLRIITPASQRLMVLRDIIVMLQAEKEVLWRRFIDTLADKYAAENKDISKNTINSMMLLARRAGVIYTLKSKSLSTAPVQLNITGTRIYQEAIIRCDRTCVEEILSLSEPIDVAEIALALYESEKYVSYLKIIVPSLSGQDPPA
ncbi:MAG: NYN domain-containing protein [Ardenticatenaceae bacterium]|nr:NYN domain-containing protein [Ardenticatenaceae bacterium]